MLEYVMLASHNFLAGSDAKEKDEEEEEKREKGRVWYCVSYDVCAGASCVTYSRLHANRQTL